MKRQRKELKEGLGKEQKTQDENDDRADDRIVVALFLTDTWGVRTRNGAVATRKNSTLAGNTIPIVLGHPSSGRTEENQTKGKLGNQKGNILDERIVVFVFLYVLQ
jgi:hypothetical protein